MTSTIKAMEVLKTDGRGRVRVSKERREALLGEFERSGLSGAKFAAHYGLKYSSFAGWVQRRKRTQAAAPATDAGSKAVQWLEAVADVEPAAGVLVVHLPGGARMEITRRTQLPLAAELLHLLSAPGDAAEAVPC
jgi:hypothetical protein